MNEQLMNEWLNEIEQELAKALRENDIEAFVSQCEALWQFVYSYAYWYLLRRTGDHSLAEELAAAVMLEVIDKEIRGAFAKERFRLNKAGEPEAYFVTTGEWATFRKWLIGVVKNVCKRKLREWNQQGEVIPAPGIDPATLLLVRDELHNWVLGIVTDLWEFAESLEEGRMWEVANTIVAFIRCNISRFISPLLPDEQWRELNFEELLEQADMIEFGKDLVANSGKLAFKTKEIWDWIQQELRDKRGKPLSRNNRDKLKERFTEALHEFLYKTTVLLENFRQAGLI